MSGINDGGPAFPHQDWDSAIHSPRRENGMSLRDWFAGQALEKASRGVNRGVTGEAIARRAYYIADSMLAERAKGGKQ
jgi:hypothetical protein